MAGDNKSVVPIGLRILRSILPEVTPATRNKLYRGLILILTFMTYASYHLSRKAITVVKNTWHPKENCSVFLDVNNSLLPVGPANDSQYSANFSLLKWPECGIPPFIGKHADLSLAFLDFTYLGSYAFFMFFMGHLGDRINLRYFLFIGMTASGILTAALGIPLWAHIYTLTFYFVIQFIAGAAQSTGWPGVVAVIGHWFGKGNRGFIMGVWNAHTSVGNILGSLIAGMWVANYNWGWAFVVPGVIIAGVGLMILLFLPVDPEAVDCTLPQHHDEGVGTRDETERLISGKRLRRSNLDINSRPATESGEYDSDDEDENAKALSVWSALKIPGVIEFSACLFFAKFVPYIFLYWLPVYIRDHKVGGEAMSDKRAADLSTLFDIGGVVGGIAAGVISDRGGTRGLTCVGMLLISIPLLWVFKVYGAVNMATFIIMLLITGFFVNGPYALITTAVSADLGNHEVLKGNHQAKATVAAIIDGTGSIGAALGPLITGIGLQQSNNWLLIIMICMGATMAAALLLTRVCIREVRRLLSNRTKLVSTEAPL